MSAITDDRGRPAPGTPAVSKAAPAPKGRITVVRNAAAGRSARPSLGRVAGSSPRRPRRWPTAKAGC